MQINKEVAEKMEVERAEIAGQANALEIKTEADSMRATNLLGIIKKARKAIDDTFKPMLDAAKATMNAIKTEKEKFSGPLEDAEAQLRSRMSAYLIAEEQRRAALQAKEDAKFAKKVEKATATGKPLTVAPVIVAKVQAAEGASISKRWYAEVTDLRALAQAALEGKVPLEYICPNEVLLNKMAVALKEGCNIPGVAAKYTISTTIRGA